MNKKSYEILKNIEILSFIEQNKLKEYIDFIVDKLNKDKEYKPLATYLNSNWFNQNYDLFNFSILKNYKINEDGENKYLEKFYVTNNISESLHAKINKYLPKKSTSYEDFSKTMKLIFLDDNFKTVNIIRYYIKTRALIEIINKENLNNAKK